MSTSRQSPFSISESSSRRSSSVVHEADTATENNNMKPDQLELSQAMAKIFNCPEVSDLEVKCEDVTFYCHQAILCTRSAFFKAACCKPDDKEPAKSIVEIHEETPSTVHALLCFLYTDTFDGTKIHSVETASERHGLLHGIRVYALAERLGVRRLKSLALFAAQNSIYAAMEQKHFVHVIDEVYGTTVEADRGLRDVLVSQVFQSLDLMLTIQPNFQAILKDNPGLSSDLVLCAILKTAKLNNHTCPSCAGNIKMIKLSAKTNLAMCYLCGCSPAKPWEHYQLGREQGASDN